MPEHYFCNLDHTGRRHDLHMRPELTHGSVEYVATQVKWRKGRKEEIKKTRIEDRGERLRQTDIDIDIDRHRQT